MSTAQQIFWGQGSFLSPQHLQALDAWQQAFGVHLHESTNPYPYGFEALQWSEEALSNGMVDVQRFSLLSSDGEWLHGGSVNHGAEANADVAIRNLQELVVTDKEPITLYLAIARDKTLDSLSPPGQTRPLPPRLTLHSAKVADPGDPQVGLGRQHVVDVQQQRRAQVVEDLDEDKCRPGQVAGHRQRKDDPPEHPHAVRTEVLRRLLHRPVDVAQGG